MIINPGRVAKPQHLPEHTLLPMCQFLGGPPIVGSFLCKECFELSADNPGQLQPGLLQVFDTAQGSVVFSWADQ